MAENDYKSDLSGKFMTLLESASNDAPQEVKDVVARLKLNVKTWDIITNDDPTSPLESFRLKEAIPLITQDIKQLGTTLKDNKDFKEAMGILEGTTKDFIEKKLHPEIGYANARLENAQNYLRALEVKQEGLSPEQIKAKQEGLSATYLKAIDDEVQGLSNDQVKEKVQAAESQLQQFASEAIRVKKQSGTDKDTRIDGSLEQLVGDMNDAAKTFAGDSIEAEVAADSKEAMSELEDLLLKWRVITEKYTEKGGAGLGKSLMTELPYSEQALAKNTDQYFDAQVTAADSAISGLLKNANTRKNLSLDNVKDLQGLQERFNSMAKSSQPKLNYLNRLIEQHQQQGNVEAVRMNTEQRDKILDKLNNVKAVATKLNDLMATPELRQKVAQIKAQENKAANTSEDPLQEAEQGTGNDSENPLESTGQSSNDQGQSGDKGLAMEMPEQNAQKEVNADELKWQAISSQFMNIATQKHITLDKAKEMLEENKGAFMTAGHAETAVDDFFNKLQNQQDIKLQQAALKTHEDRMRGQANGKVAASGTGLDKNTIEKVESLGKGLLAKVNIFDKAIIDYGTGKSAEEFAMSQTPTVQTKEQEQSFSAPQRPGTPGGTAA